MTSSRRVTSSTHRALVPSTIVESACTWRTAVTSCRRRRTAFDVITGEPPPPRTPGAVNIYTREYFQLIYSRLNEGGLATYWVPVARPDPGTDVSTIIRAFCDVFADCSLWNGTPSDLMLVGSRRANGRVSEHDFVSAWQRPALAET